jgi:hypothetical protein
LEVSSVEATDGLLGFVGGWHFYETESARALRFTICDDLRALDLSVDGKGVAQVGVACVETHVSDKNSHSVLLRHWLPVEDRRHRLEAKCVELRKQKGISQDLWGTQSYHNAVWLFSGATFENNQGVAVQNRTPQSVDRVQGAIV